MSLVVLTRDTAKTIQFGTAVFEIVDAAEPQSTRTSMTLTAVTDSEFDCEEEDVDRVAGNYAAFEEEASDEEDDDATITTCATYHQPAPKVRFATAPAPKRVTIVSSSSAYSAPFPIYDTPNMPGPSDRLLDATPPLVNGQIYASHHHYTNAFNRVQKQQVIVGGPLHPTIRSLHPTSRPMWLGPQVDAVEELDLPAPRARMLDSPELDYENGRRRTEKSDEEEEAEDLEKNQAGGDPESDYYYRQLPLPYRQISIAAMSCFYDGVDFVKEAYEKASARLSASEAETPANFVTTSGSSSSLIIAEKPAVSSSSSSSTTTPAVAAPTLLKPALVRNKPLRLSNGSAALTLTNSTTSTTLVPSSSTTSNSEESLTTRYKPRGPRPQPPSRRTVSASSVLMHPNSGITTHCCPILTSLGTLSSTSSACNCHKTRGPGGGRVDFAVDLEAQVSVRRRERCQRHGKAIEIKRGGSARRYAEAGFKWLKALDWRMLGILGFAVFLLSLCIMVFVLWVH